MKKLRYSAENSTFVFKYLFVMSVILIIVCTIYEIATKGITNVDYGNLISSFFISVIILMILVALPMYLIICLVNLKDIRKIKKIKEKGTVVDGTIIAWDLDVSYGEYSSINYYVYVRYNDLNQEEKIFKTPSLNFNPKRHLGSANCRVYLFDNDVYVMNFVNAKTKDECIFKDTEPGLK